MTWLREKISDILFLQETKLIARHMNKLKFRLGFERCLGVDCEGKGGGPALLWKKDVDITILKFSKYHIHALVHSN